VAGQRNGVAGARQRRVKHSAGESPLPFVTSAIGQNSKFDEPVSVRHRPERRSSATSLGMPASNSSRGWVGILTGRPGLSCPLFGHLPAPKRRRCRGADEQFEQRLGPDLDEPAELPRPASAAPPACPMSRQAVSRVAPASNSSSGWVGILISRPSRRTGVGH
jgi:hypothetical protein